MEVEIKLLLVKFALYALAVCIAAHVGWADALPDLLLPADEREQRTDAMATVDALKTTFPVLADKVLNSHEILVAASLIAPDPRVTFGGIGGHVDIKHELMLHVVVPMTHPHLFFGNASLKPPAGILLSGPPGTGKTMLAKALATECRVPLLCVKSSLVEQKYYGESEKVVRAIFTLAVKIAPCIVFVDEIDGMLRNRSDFEQSATYSTKTQFLQEMDGLDAENVPVVVVAATNNPQALDRALYRRLPRTYTVGKPDASGRHEILTNLTRAERKIDATVLDTIAEQTDGFSGSDLKDTYKAAASLRNEVFSETILKQGHVSSSPGPIQMKHWTAAVMKTRQSIRFA